MSFNLNDLDYKGREVYYVKTIDRKDQEIKSIKSQNKSLIAVLIFFVGIYVFCMIGLFYKNNFYENQISKIKKEYETKLIQSKISFDNVKDENTKLKEILISYLAQDTENKAKGKAINNNK